MNRKKTVFVGLSGGVDSSVAALRLKKLNFNVVGVFIKVWHPNFMICNWQEERLDAMRVAAHLDIPFLTCDAERTYKNEVAEYFIDEYTSGRTPNPDVMCNKQIKFGAFLKFAKDRGADYIATGHYAQKIDKNGHEELHRGVDQNKDQTYFLWTLSQEQLSSVIFPIGDTEKHLIRQEAKMAKIPTAEKKDSQGICFLGHVDIREFLSHFVKLVNGNVLDENKQIIGTHSGALIYTLGQRHGFNLNVTSNESVPMYVTDRNLIDNTITVGTKKPTSKSGTNLVLTDISLRTELSTGDEVEVQFRYRQKPSRAQIKTVGNESIEIIILDESDAPVSGQSCVLYTGTHCVGGGIIS